MFFIFLLLSLLLLHTGVQAEDPIIQQCSNTAEGEIYTSNSQFETNLNLLLSSLLSNGTRDGFFSTSIGTGPDTVYGLVSCRADLLKQRCRNCLYNSTVDVFRICPMQKQALLLYGDCILRYSNYSRAFTKVDDISSQALYNTGKVPDADADHFRQQLSTLLNNLLNNAASIPTRYDFGRIDYKPLQPIEGLAQCIRDLSGTDCYTCLRNLMRYIRVCCENNVGGLYYTTSCFFRFEIYPFLQTQPKTIFPRFDDSPPQSNAIPSPGVETSPTPSNKGNSTKVFPPFEASPPQLNKGTRKGKSTKVFTIVVPLFGSLVLLAISAYLTHWLLRRNKMKKIPEINYKDMEEMRSAESLEYNFREVRDATENFADANKLGKGGFGIVYKGLLSDGRQIAVKRLSNNSGQGVVEFKNEVLLVVKLQHRNLVKLLGFCLEEDEKLLIYEFAENKSLDHYIFDPLKRTYLDWETRYKIIGGIARGLLYLHVDSRLRIIHRDLKAANILLDGHMEPKISDFGMARLFGVDQTDGSTGRIVGTYGYMAPEYAMHGQFSVKSDVFSFGVLILEIISGQKNTSFFQSEHVDNLNSYAWRHWENGSTSELIDPTLKEHYSSSEIIRYINIGLLCVQEDVTKRPTMATVVHMLNTDSVALPLPSTPAFFVSRMQSISRTTTDSINEVSMTGFYPR